MLIIEPFGVIVMIIGNGNNNASSGSNYAAGKYQVTASTLRVRSGPGTNYRIVAKLHRGNWQGVDYTVGSWGHLTSGAGWICLDYCIKEDEIQTSSADTYQVTASALRVRSGPGTNYKIVTKLYRGSKQQIDYIRGSWGHLANGSGWICLDYCIKYTGNSYLPGSYRVTASALRVRTGPSTNYKIISRVYRGNVVKIDSTIGEWGHLANGTGWICLNYARKV